MKRSLMKMVSNCPHTKRHHEIQYIMNKVIFNTTYTQNETSLNIIYVFS